MSDQQWYLDSWSSRRALREWRRVRPRVLVAEGRKDWAMMRAVYEELKPFMLAGFRDLFPPGTEPTVSKMAGWISCCSYAAEVLGRMEEESLWEEFMQFYLFLHDKGLLPIWGDVLV